MNQRCEICITNEAIYDAKTKVGPWGYMCQRCFDKIADKRSGTYTTLVNIGKPSRKPYED